jgi:hypothetical protein
MSPTWESLSHSTPFWRWSPRSWVAQAPKRNSREYVTIGRNTYPPCLRLAVSPLRPVCYARGCPIPLTYTRSWTDCCGRMRPCGKRRTSSSRRPGGCGKRSRSTRRGSSHRRSTGPRRNEGRGEVVPAFSGPSDPIYLTDPPPEGAADGTRKPCRPAGQGLHYGSFPKPPAIPGRRRRT